MNTEKPALILERDGPVVVIINNDAPMNRMTLEFIDALEQSIAQLALSTRGPGGHTDRLA